MIRVSVQPAPIDLATELAGIEAHGAGGVATFTGLVRGDDGVTVLGHVAQDAEIGQREHRQFGVEYAGRDLVRRAHHCASGYWRATDWSSAST